jgi:hypothetical protein
MKPVSGEEGVFGLAYSTVLGGTHGDRTSYASPLYNLRQQKRQLQQQLSSSSTSSSSDGFLRHPIFSTYLNSNIDACPPPPSSTSTSTLTSTTTITKKDVRPILASSQLIFDGINSTLYEGCIHWHDGINLAQSIGGGGNNQNSNTNNNH